MEIKPTWVYLCLTLLSISFDTGVASRLLNDKEQYAYLEYHETKKENVMAEIMDRKLESLSEVISDLQDSITVKLEAITALQYDLNKKIQEITDKKLSEQTPDINKQETDKIQATCNHRHVTESIEKLNFRLVAVENNLQNRILQKFDELEINRNREVKEITDKLNLLTKNTQQLTEKMDSSNRGTTAVPESIECTSTRQAVDIADLDKLNQLFEIVKNNSNISASDGSMMSPFCNLSVPSSVDIVRSNWYDNPASEDELDIYVATTTGCAYKALASRENFKLPSVTFDGTLFEWRGAIRAAENGDIVVRWTDHAGYAFYIGVDDNRDITVMYQRRPWMELERRSTPDILSADRYVPFYIRIHAGTLTFWRACEREPLFSRAVSLERGQQIYLEFFPFSRSGGKHLYNCPAGVAAP